MCNLFLDDIFLFNIFMFIKILNNYCMGSIEISGLIVPTELSS
ncbi:putative ORfan [Saudi moumouvirus]|nr:putative ORfan [Saudi moumouvirus]